MGKQSGKQSELGSFSFGYVNDPGSDCIFFTFGVPKIIDVPFVGHASIQSISVAAATIVVPWLYWLGRRKVRQIQQQLKERREKREEEAKKAESPAKAKQWDSKPGGKLDDFMSEVRANKEQLRKVEDPDTVEKRMAKREKIVKEQKKKPKGKLGLTEDLLQGTRSGLKQASTNATLSPRANHKSKVIEELSTANNDLLQGARLGLRKVSNELESKVIEEHQLQGVRLGLRKVSENAPEKDPHSIDDSITVLQTNLERDIQEHTKQLNEQGKKNDEAGNDQGSRCIIS